MKLYHSAFAIKEEFTPLLKGKKLRILRSYATSKDVRKPAYCKGIFLDSGAYSAFNSGKYIDLYEYMDFIRDNEQNYEIYAGLDVIGDAKATLENQKIMDSEGLEAVPTFHITEPMKYLEHYAKNYPYIALGVMAGKIGTSTLRPWLDECWGIIKKTNPGIKVHGFGITDFGYMARYPWHSVDATTAGKAGRLGVLTTPWGFIDVSKGLKKYKNYPANTPRKKKIVLDWVTKFVPGMIDDWGDIANPTKEATQLRMIINALFLESEAKKEKNEGEEAFRMPRLFG